jgi:hypothetical protein
MRLNLQDETVRAATYLGDAVYMTDLDQFQGVWLFTTDGLRVTNEIYFELEVWEAMIREYARTHPKTDKHP